MTFLIVGSITAGFVAFSSGLFVYLKNHKSPLNTSFFLMNICVAIWNCGETLIYLSPNNDVALLRDRISYLGGIFIPHALFGLSMAIIAAAFYFITFLYPAFPKIHFIIEILYFCIFAYAITKHRLMDITVVFKWSSIIGGVAICLTGIYIAGLVIAEFVLSRYMHLSAVTLRIIVVAVMALTLTPFFSTIKHLLLSIFLRREQETEDDLEGLSRYLLTQLNFEEDILLLVTELESIMRTQCVTVTMYDGKIGNFRSEISVNFEEQLKKFTITESAMLA